MDGRLWGLSCQPAVAGRVWLAGRPAAGQSNREHALYGRFYHPERRPARPGVHKELMSKIKHIALFNFKADTSPEQIDQLFQEIMDLSETIPGIEDYVSGPNNSPENLNDGFTHGFVMTFADAAARDAYLPHPDHEKIKANLLNLVEKVIVLDFEV